ncbi:aminopeptidase [Halopiger goleimassiliensis]|uniref:aminopeptidase n=1 Tax=Halopiger goleimassiliensis TaxID=1293048 RepID=UPI0018A84308|nr:aminopeptidase [Halopiger goleimassiliensis]
MAAAARGIVENCLDVQPGEEVLVIADAKKEEVGRAVARAATGAGADAITTTMPLLESHGNEPPETVAEAMKAADVAFTCTTHAITHTRSRLEAAEAGTRFGILRSVTEEMMVEGAMSVDFEELRRRTEAVRDVLDAASDVHVTSDKGTDVTFSVDGCSAFSLDGYFHENYGFATLPPGESPTHPAEDTANGTIVVDVSMDNLGQLEEPITLELEDGYVSEVSGGEQADELRQLIEESDENAGNLAEFAIGTNPEAKLIGNLAEDKKRAGTVHFAIGDNESLGGTRKSEIHLDGVVRTPTVRLDDQVVVEDGQLVEDVVQ